MEEHRHVEQNLHEEIRRVREEHAIEVARYREALRRLLPWMAKAVNSDVFDHCALPVGARRDYEFAAKLHDQGVRDAPSM